MLSVPLLELERPLTFGEVAVTDAPLIPVTVQTVSHAVLEAPKKELPSNIVPVVTQAGTEENAKVAVAPDIVAETVAFWVGFAGVPLQTL